MLSNISFAPAFTQFQPIFSSTIESEICVSVQTMKRQFGGKMIFYRHYAAPDALVFIVSMTL